MSDFRWSLNSNLHYSYLQKFYCCLFHVTFDEMPARYHELRLSSSDDEEEMKSMPVEAPSYVGILGKSARFGSPRWRIPSYWPWILATFVFATLSFELHFQTTGALPTRCKQQLWMKSELGRSTTSFSGIEKISNSMFLKLTYSQNLLEGQLSMCN